MHGRRTWTRIVVFGLLAWALPAAAFHTVFEYGIDRVEADGNVYGPSDGSLDRADDFDDGVLAPWWQNFFGTAFEQNGYLIFTNPGTHFSLTGLPFETDQSDVISAGGPFVQDGAGNLTVRIFWRPAIVATNHYLHTTVLAGTDLLGLAVTNFDDSIAQRYDPPWPTGLVVTAHRETLNGLNLITMQREHLAIGTGSATGALVFELAYDDTAKQWQAGVSTDGGATFDRSFAPMPIPSFTGSGTATGSLIMGADPYELPANPPPTACEGVGLYDGRTVFSGLERPAGQQTVKVRGRFGQDTPIDVAAEGAEVFVRDDAGVLIGILLPAGPGCDSRDGWVASGQTYRYRNLSGALPPACTPGAAALVTAKVRFDGSWNGLLKVKVRKTTTARPVNYVHVDFVRGVTVALPQCQGFSEDHLYCTSNANRAKCQR